MGYKSEYAKWCCYNILTPKQNMCVCRTYIALSHGYIYHCAHNSVAQIIFTSPPNLREPNEVSHHTPGRWIPKLLCEKHHWLTHYLVCNFLRILFLAQSHFLYYWEHAHLRVQIILKNNLNNFTLESVTNTILKNLRL